MGKKIWMITYPSEDGFRWRAMTANNKIVADSAEAYVSRRNARRAAKMFISADEYEFFDHP